jgi:glycosyltransferase involved in cell wall biosynthesis
MGQREGPPYRLVVFGHIGPNRRMDALLLALAEFPERDRFHLDIYGQLWDMERVRDQLRALALKGLVTLHGFVPERELNAALAVAHLVINLRYPTMGEASVAQLQVWDHALPSLVTRVGWYARLPEDAVAFVRPEHEIADIQAHLGAFLANPARFARMGEIGRRILVQYHTPEAYAQAILAFAADAQRFHQRAVAFNLAERAGAEMGAWMSPTAPEEALRKVAEEIHLLTNEKLHHKES